MWIEPTAARAAVGSTTVRSEPPPAGPNGLSRLPSPLVTASFVRKDGA
jgi:hypothetical protein